VPGTGQQVYYSGTLVVSTLFGQRDVNVLNLRYGEAPDFTTTLLTWDTRVPIGKHLRINPRLRLGVWEGTQTGVRREMVTALAAAVVERATSLPTGDRARAGGYRAHVQFGRAGFHRQIPKPRLSRGLSDECGHGTELRSPRSRSAALVAGCAGGGRLEQLDEQFRCDDRPRSAVLVYARTEPRYSRSARDYVYLGPRRNQSPGCPRALPVGGRGDDDRSRLSLPPEAQEPRTLYVEVRGEADRAAAESVARSSFRPGSGNRCTRRSCRFGRSSPHASRCKQLALIGAAAPASVSLAMGESSAPRTFIRLARRCEL